MEARALFGVCGVAAVVRAFYLWELSGSPWLEGVFCDELWFDGLAERVAAGESPSGASAYTQPPAYPYALGLFYAAFGRDVVAVRIAQAALGVVNVGLLYLVARRACGARVALVSALVCAVWAPMLFFEAQLLKTVLLVFWNLLFFLALLACIDRPGPGRALLAGALLGASALTQPIALPFAGVLAVAAWWARGRLQVSGRALASLGLAFLLGCVLVIGTATVRNARVSGRFVPISTNSGINLYLGVGDDFEEKVATRPGRKWDALYSREDDEYLGESLRGIAADPLGYARNAGVKLFHFAHGDERPRCRSLYAARADSALLSFLVWKRGLAFPFGVLFPFALLGCVQALRRGSAGARLMVLFCATHAALLALLFVTARFRMAVLPFLVVLAVCGAVAWAELWRARRWRAAVAATAALLGLFVVSNWKVGPMRGEPFADVYWTLGLSRLEQEREEACRYLERAAYLDPDREAAWWQACSSGGRNPWRGRSAP